MANLTLSIPDPDLARARRVAAERGTTINALVREFLVRETATVTTDQREAIDWMVAQSNANAGRGTGPLPTRAELYTPETSPRF